MKKYVIDLTSEVVARASIEVEAENEDEARRIAVEKVLEDDNIWTEPNRDPEIDVVEDLGYVCDMCGSFIPSERARCENCEPRESPMDIAEAVKLKQ